MYKRQFLFPLSQSLSNVSGKHNCVALPKPLVMLRNTPSFTVFLLVHDLLQS